MHNLFISGNIDETKGQYIFLDNDFLSALFSDKDLFELILNLFKDAFLAIDPLTRLEFLRDVFLARQRSIKEQFINDPIFLPTLNRGEQNTKIQENALLISRIVAHKGKNDQRPELIDLLLSGRCMEQNFSLIATGNKRHYPSILFKTLVIVSYEKEEASTFQHFFILQFDKAKFKTCLDDLDAIISK